MADYQDDIRQALEDVNSAQMKIAEAYLGRLREIYSSALPEVRDLMHHRLEHLVVELEEMKRKDQDESLRKGEKKPFDKAWARGIREAYHMSQADLGRKVGVSGATIGRYEREGIKSGTDESVKYLNWLGTASEKLRA